MAAEQGEFGGFDNPPGQWNQGGGMLPESAAGARCRRQRADCQATVCVSRVPEEQAENLTPRITGGTGNRNPHRVDHPTILHGYAFYRKLIPPGVSYSPTTEPAEIPPRRALLRPSRRSSSPAPRARSST